jgi:phage-related protein
MASSFPLKRIAAEFFRSDRGREPVRDFLKAIPRLDRKVIGEDIRTVEYGWPIGMPVCDHLGSKLYEVRSTSGKREYRVLFSVYGDRMVLLHVFVKKTQKTPGHEIKTALERRREMEKRK